MTTELAQTKPDIQFEYTQLIYSGLVDVKKCVCKKEEIGKEEDRLPHKISWVGK